MGTWSSRETYISEPHVVYVCVYLFSELHDSNISQNCRVGPSTGLAGADPIGPSSLIQELVTPGCLSKDTSAKGPVSSSITRKRGEGRGEARAKRGAPCGSGSRGAAAWEAVLVQCYLSNTASFVLCAVYSVKDHHNLPNYSPLLTKTCIRQVVLDKWFPLALPQARPQASRRRGGRWPVALRPSCMPPAPAYIYIYIYIYTYNVEREREYIINML